MLGLRPIGSPLMPAGGLDQIDPLPALIIGVGLMVWWIITARRRDED